MSTSPQGALRLLLEKPMGLPQSRAGMLPDGDSQKEKRKFGKVPVVAQRFVEDVRCCPQLRPSQGSAARMAGEAEPMGRQTKRGLNTEVPNPQQKPACIIDRLVTVPLLLSNRFPP